VWGLAFVGAPAKGATPAVVLALSDTSAQVRRKAAYAVGRIDPDPALAVNALVTRLADREEDVRQAAAETLPKMGDAAVPALIRMLYNDKPNHADVAVRLLGEIGAGAAPAIGELKKLLLAPSQGLAPAAAEALAKIGGAPAIAVLSAAAVDDDGTVRGLAVPALQRVGTAAVPALVDLLGAKHVDVRRQAAALLGAMQVNDKMVVIGLGYATKDKDFGVRRNALKSLQNMVPVPSWPSRTSPPCWWTSIRRSARRRSALCKASASIRARD